MYNQGGNNNYNPYGQITPYGNNGHDNAMSAPNGRMYFGEVPAPPEAQNSWSDIFNNMDGNPGTMLSQDPRITENLWVLNYRMPSFNQGQYPHPQQGGGGFMGPPQIPGGFQQRPPPQMQGYGGPPGMGQGGGQYPPPRPQMRPAGMGPPRGPPMGGMNQPRPAMGMNQPRPPMGMNQPRPPPGAQTRGLARPPPSEYSYDSEGTGSSYMSDLSDAEVSIKVFVTIVKRSSELIVK
ncbi:hypothetical protein CBS101457_003222 [Exobasidium rhododendri]|nr:hypothetical protein CBS101457_003222 [Exobasidium rhododendri]